MIEQLAEPMIKMPGMTDPGRCKMSEDVVGDRLQECIGRRLEHERAAIKIEQQMMANKFIQEGDDPLVAKCKAWSVVFSAALYDIIDSAKDHTNDNQSHD